MPWRRWGRWRNAVPPDPTRAGPFEQAAGGLASLADRLEEDVVLQAHHGVGAQIANPLEEPRAPHAPIGQHEHAGAFGQRGPEQAQKAQQRGHPRPGPIGRQNVPGDRERGAPIKDADAPDDHLVAFAGGIHRQGQVGALPPGKDPAPQGGKADRHVQARLTRRRPVGTVVEPLAQVLAHGVVGADRQQGANHGGLAGAVGKKRPVDPPGQSALLGRPQGRQVRRDRFLDLVPFRTGAHGQILHHRVLLC